MFCLDHLSVVAIWGKNKYPCSTFLKVVTGMAPRSTQPFILSRSIKRVPGISGNLVVKSKLASRSGCSLEAVEPHP